MSLDPHTPVIIGVGQVNQRDESPEVEPVDLMASAAREAADPRVLQALDSIRVVNLLSWRYRDPGLLLGERIGAADAATVYTGIGGNTPQSLLNRACRDIQQGRADAVLLAGGETWRTRMRLLSWFPRMRIFVPCSLASSATTSDFFRWKEKSPRCSTVSSGWTRSFQPASSAASCSSRESNGRSQYVRMFLCSK